MLIGGTRILEPRLTAITNFDDRDPITINHDFGDRDHDLDHDRKISLFSVIAITKIDRDHCVCEHTYC